MDHPPRRIALLGSTGSIGQSTLEVVAASRGRLEVVALAARQRLADLCKQARQLRPRFVVATDAEAARGFDWSQLPRETEPLIGPEGLSRIVRLPEVDIVLSAIVGSAGLTGTWEALDAGKPVALANKETLVMAGPQVMRLSAQRGAKILPVDSEHSAVFQLLEGQSRDQWSRCTADDPPTPPRPLVAALKRIILTASGGPFRCWSREQMETATVADALAHPTWRMGDKITIDSATMMNKALEIIEARWLFDLPPEQIEVVVHPQSVVHSLVEYVDGSVLAQLSPPDMKLPIQYALTWPERQPSPARRLDWTEALRLEFEPPDEDRFPALKLGREVAAAGGTAGAVLNAANEAAVASFLAGEMPFMEIVPACRAVLESHHFDAEPSLDELLVLDGWARQEMQRWIVA
ncbi:MAG TPA: 1-deoxy-D-xylulose-5-phosphate reductoisomerase [Pirellulaceae bacterium]|nr:1-deoxy-D-xylulose-5-phosphate reductoisomerase [Pirellulaceae bacterium]